MTPIGSIDNGDVLCFLSCWWHHHVSHNMHRSRPFASEILLSNNHMLLYYVNSDLMFYFIWLNFSFKCLKKKKWRVLHKYITGFTTVLYVYIYQHPYLSLKREDVNHCPKLCWLHWNEAKLIDLIWKIKTIFNFLTVNSIFI